jgi:mannose-6-phosphate isomerase-like protein (cupin superfamily)
MKRKTLRFGDGFHVIFGNRVAQAAEMTLAPRASEGGPDNRHRGADQWLFVVSGTGAAVVNEKRYPLRAGTLLLIEHRDTHEIRNTGRTPLRTLNIYAPPAYTAAGDDLPPGRS